MRKRKQKQARKPEPFRSHFIATPMADVQLAASSCEIDAAADQQWFVAHPGAKSRIRPTTLLELTGFDLPLGSQTRVVRMTDGRQLRIFLVPDDRGP
jgi:hypothetical protein